MIEPKKPRNERSRLQALRALEILDTPPEERFDRITRVASLVFNTPIALVSLVDENRQWFKSCIGLDASETSRGISFCGHAILQRDPLIIPDATKDPRFFDNPLVTGEPNIRFYAGQPLHSSEGHSLGTLCVVDRRPREFGDRELQVLKELGMWAERELLGIKTAEATLLVRENEDRLKRILDGLPVGVLIADGGGEIYFRNRTGRRLGGVSMPQGIRARQIVHTLKIYKAGTDTPYPPSGSTIAKALRGKSSRIDDVEIQQRDGSRRAFEVHGSPIRNRVGKVEFAVAAFTDITVRRRLEWELREERSRAAELQQSLLPGAYASPGLEIAGKCISAKDVGGDFYDWQELRPGVISVTLGDVMGKGMPAALLMATVRAGLRAVSLSHGPAKAVEMAAKALFQDLDRNGSYVTLFHAQVGVATGRVLYVDAGHGLTMVARREGGVRELGERGLPLGIDPAGAYTEGVVQLEVGDALVAYSDGVLEVMGEGADSRALLAGALAKGASAQEMVEALTRIPDSAPLHQDDVTALVLRRLRRA